MLQDFMAGERTEIMKSLTEMAAKPAWLRYLFLLFHALGDNVKPKALRQTNDGMRNSLIFWVTRQNGHE
jgi:hypothetical protein